eukprot:1497650-Amphidinium_carterae.1
MVEAPVFLVVSDAALTGRQGQLQGLWLRVLFFTRGSPFGFHQLSLVSWIARLNLKGLSSRCIRGFSWEQTDGMSYLESPLFCDLGLGQGISFA